MMLSALLMTPYGVSVVAVVAVFAVVTVAIACTVMFVKIELAHLLSTAASLGQLEKLAKQ